MLGWGGDWMENGGRTGERTFRICVLELVKSGGGLVRDKPKRGQRNRNTVIRLGSGTKLVPRVGSVVKK